MIPYHGCQHSGQPGHYESWFLRANHPSRAQAFWIRYTLFVPRDKRPSLGELWAIWFDGEQNKVIAVKQEHPLSGCEFDSGQMKVRIGDARLDSHLLTGCARHNGHEISWNLGYEGEPETLLFLPENLYKARLPKAKSVVSRPQVSYRGKLMVDGEEMVVDRWPGSENHNWGSQHTDQYAWGQVAAFDDAPGAFLECITARVKVGPLRSPWMSIACLRVDGRDYLFNSLGRAFRADGRYHFFDWQLTTSNGRERLSVSMSAPSSHFTALTYYNPPRGSKTCLNSKIARCEVRLERPGEPPLTLTSAHGAAFEILTDREDHGVPLSV